MILEWQSRLADAVRAAAHRAFGAELDGVSFQYPPRLELGDLALTAPFDLAKGLRRKPREVAERLIQELTPTPGVTRAEVAGGGYVNLFLDRARFARELFAALRDPRPAPAVPGAVIVEHTSVNPNKAAHVGHLRNATLGDSFVRVLRGRGRTVGVQNYIDDTGVQVADVVVGFERLERKTLADVEAIRDRFDYYCWDLYARVGDYYAADPSRKQEQLAALHAIEAGDNPTARLAERVVTRIVDCHLRTMDRLAIRYDLLAHESDILRLHFWERAFELLKRHGAIRLETDGKNHGCWVLAMDRASEPSGPEPEERAPADDDKVIVRSNGTVTYTGKDIAYQLWKLGRLDCDFRYRPLRVDPDGHVLWTTTSGEGAPNAPAFGHARAVYNVIDVGQSYPQRVVKAGVAALGHADAAEASHHLAYEKVVLSPATARALGYEVGEQQATVKVSGRKGLGVKADDLVDALVAKAHGEIVSRDPERPAAALEASANAIAVGALRYFLLKYGRNKVITFDMEEALAFTGETGPYIQNAVVRARSIFAKLAADGHDVERLLARPVDLARQLEGAEGSQVWGLLLAMSRSEEVAEQVIRSQELALLAKHGFAVAQAFHAYYQRREHSVLYAVDDDQRAFRLGVVDAFVRQMQILTGWLGIPLPERM